MRIGFSGAHRTGKTTLAKKVSEIYGYEFIAGSATPVFNRFGVTPNQYIPIKTRFEIQRAVLDDFCERVSGSNRFVTDRTPFDFIGYMRAELCTNAFFEENTVTERELTDYFNQCYEAAAKYLDLTIFLEPALPIVFEEGKGSLNKHYIHNVSALMFDALSRRPQDLPTNNICTVLDADVGSRIEQRIVYVRGIIDEYPSLVQHVHERMNEEINVGSLSLH